MAAIATVLNIRMVIRTGDGGGDLVGRRVLNKNNSAVVILIHEITV